MFVLYDAANMPPFLKNMLKQPLVLEGNRERVQASHFMDEFQISGWEARMNVKRAFDALYMRLGKELEAATSSNDMDLQLVVLNSWGLRMKPEDHALLLQVRLFDNLHTILAQPEDVFILEDGNENEVKILRRLKQAAIKLVVLLATDLSLEEGNDQGGNLRSISCYYYYYYYY